jgi:hypothetical protein
MVEHTDRELGLDQVIHVYIHPRKGITHARVTWQMIPCTKERKQALNARHLTRGEGKIVFDNPGRKYFQKISLCRVDGGIKFSFNQKITHNFSGAG